MSKLRSLECGRNQIESRGRGGVGEGAFNFQPGESVSELISWRYLSLFRLNAASGASSPVGEWLGTRRLLSESIPRKAKRAVVISRRKTQFSRHARCTRRDRHFVALSISRADRCRFFSPLVSSFFFFFFFFFNKKKPPRYHRARYAIFLSSDALPDRGFNICAR